MLATADTTDDDAWSRLLAKAGQELCGALGLGNHSFIGKRDELPAGRLGACIPLVGALHVQLILLSSNSGLRALAEALMCHEDSDEPLTGVDVKDAIRELANQFAGLAKRHLSKHGELRLGLPMFVRGTVKPPPGRRLYVHDVCWGSTEVTLGLFSSE